MPGHLLEIPSLSQSNATHDAYTVEEDGNYRALEIAHSENLDVNPASGYSTVWCGRASASMIYNYFQLVEAHQSGEEEATAHERFIINNRDRDSGRPLDLIYPSDEVACHNGSSYYALAEPLNRVATGWKRRALLSGNDRTDFNADDDPTLEVTAGNIEAVLEPITDSLNRNTPVLAYTGLSTNVGNPRHIIVVSGYKQDESGDLWLHFTDPSTMRDNEAAIKGASLNPSTMPDSRRASSSISWTKGTGPRAKPTAQPRATG